MLRWNHLWLAAVLMGSASRSVFGSVGCCSHHGGVSGCAGAGLGCADGSLSPSCGCNSGGETSAFHQAVKPPNLARAKRAVQTAVNLLDTPYAYGQADASGTDCSGLVQQAYPDYFPQRESSAEQLKTLEDNGDENVPVNQLQAGDLVYFKNGSGNVAHAAIVENNQPSKQQPVGIIAASSNEKHAYVLRETIGKDGSLGTGLRYAGGGRPH